MIARGVFVRFAVLSFVFLSFLSISVSATDYHVDTEFPDLGFASPDVVYDVYVHTDGKFVVAGEDFSGSTSVPFLKRYFANGTLDTSFTSQIQTAGGSSQNYVTRIWKVLPNGQYLVGGRFTVASTFGYWARLNSDGSFDSTIPTATINGVLRGVQDDEKLLFCGPRTENGITYNTLFRRNADLSFDPTFRITFSDAGNCPVAYPLPSGQILLNGDLTTGGPVFELKRINSDGTLDLTFDPAITATSNVRLLSLLPDGKILIGNSGTVRLLSADGSQIRETPYCSSTIGIGLADGSFMVNGCKKWVSGTRTFDFLRIKPDGSVEQSMDWVAIAGFEGLKGFREDGSGGFYLFGGISTVNSFNRRGLIRLVPDSSIKKARFDFDGDGRSDLAVFRPSDGVWYLNQSTAGIKYRQWGFPTDRVAAADADMDQKTDIGVVRDGAWHALTNNDAHMYMCLGAAGDKPFVGSNHEYLGQRDFLVSRRSQGSLVQWFIRSNYINCWTNNQQPIPNYLVGELETDIPVVADLNGDSLDDISYFRDGTWYVADPNGVAAPMTVQWGSAGDIPVPGDYDGDRQSDFAIFRPSTGEWWINRSSAGPIVITFGLNGDIPVPADYDGDGKVDIAIYRNGQWWRYLSQTGSVTVDYWGSAGDIPIPAQAQF